MQRSRITEKTNIKSQLKLATNARGQHPPHLSVSTHLCLSVACQLCPSWVFFISVGPVLSRRSTRRRHRSLGTATTSTQKLISGRVIFKSLARGGSAAALSVFCLVATETAPWRVGFIVDQTHKAILLLKIHEWVERTLVSEPYALFRAEAAEGILGWWGKEVLAPLTKRRSCKMLRRPQKKFILLALISTITR